MYDNPYWEYHLPVNPPGSYFREGFDVALESVELANWNGEDGPEFRLRPRENVNTMKILSSIRRNELGPATDDEAPELDKEYDCD